MDCQPATVLAPPSKTAETSPSSPLDSAKPTNPDVAIPRFTPQIRSAMLLLLDAVDCARDAGTDVWQFSIEFSALRRLGLSKTECRWLVAKGLAKHACENTTPEAERRTFQPCNNLAFPKGTCFVIADRGAAYATALLRSESTAVATRPDPDSISNSYPSHHSNGSPPPAFPTWDSDRQQLRIGRTVVKEFKVPAANQEAVLAAFQEENWAPRIDDPLPPAPNQDPKRRLHDTINSLNRNQKQSLIRFLGDGKGEGVRWEFVTPQDGVRPADAVSIRL
jgi:hypothetical protein